jgi:uncharacterized protein (TIGR00661 family)
MKILYGVVGEGMGHAMRSRVVLEHLTRQGHEIHVIASQRAVDYLSKHFENVRRIHGLSIVYEENRVRRGKTFWANVRDGLAALPGQIKAYFDLIDEFRPEVVVSDFESWTYLYGKLHRLPVLSVDNIQMINRCRHDDEIRGYDRGAFEVARAFVKSKLPHCDHYLISTFYYPELRKERTSLYPAILRPEIIDTAPTEGEHLLVYQTAEGNDALANMLAASGQECRVYGMRRGIKEDQFEGKVRYRPFSESEFIKDLASARAVVAGGGFTLMSECVYLHKPVLATPISGQFEQTLNSLYLEREGYGKFAAEVNQETLSAFLRSVPGYAKNLERYSQDGNRLLLSALDGFLLQLSSPGHGARLAPT